MGTLWQDIRYGVRMLARNPGFTALVVVVLGIGIGATTVMLSVVDAVMLRPCPYQDPDTLVCIWETNKGTNYARNITSRAGFQDWQEQNRVFARMVGVSNWDCIAQSADKTERTRAMYVSPGFFSLLGLQPVLGRVFLPEEEQIGGAGVVVLSHSHWRRYFGGDPGVIGKTLVLDQQVYTVIGVLPKDFRWFFQRYAVCGLWLPMSLKPDPGTSRMNRGTSVIARLKPGVSVAQAQAEMDLVADRLARTYPDALANTGIAVVPLKDEYARVTLAAGQPRTLMVLLGIVGAVLLIACLHVASLLIARSAARNREVAVRAALGARRLRLIRQLLGESVLLAGLGGLLGSVLAYWGTLVISAVRGPSVPWYLGDIAGRLIPWFVEIRMDGRMLLYGGGISLLTCMLFGVLPALSASKTRLSESLSAGRTPTDTPRLHRLRASLVGADVALAFMLLAGAGLLAKSYVRLLNVDPQFDPRNVLSLDADLDWQRPPYSDANRRLAFFRQAVERIGSLPGAACVAAASASPVTGSYSTNTFEIEGLPPADNRLDVPCTKIMADYFRVLRVPLLRGRFFTEQETATVAPVVIVNEALARRCWPDENPIGKHVVRVAREGPEPLAREIIGVVRNMRHSRYTPQTPEIYLPGCDEAMVLLVRAGPGALGLGPALRGEVMAVDRNVPVSGVTLVEKDRHGLHAQDRFNTFFLGAFAITGLLLASLGIYGTVAYTVSRRTHEIGVRMALGARRSDIMRAVLRQGLQLTLAGLVIGLVGALAATRIIRSLLYEVSPTDPLTFVCVAVLLSSVTLLASYIPARRAAKVDPMVALRYE